MPDRVQGTKRLTIFRNRAIFLACNEKLPYQVQFIWKGNQVRCLSDPVTVYREWASKSIAYPMSARRRSRRWSVSQETCLIWEKCFRVKQNTPHRLAAGCLYRVSQTKKKWNVVSRQWRYTQTYLLVLWLASAFYKSKPSELRTDDVPQADLYDRRSLLQSAMQRKATPFHFRKQATIQAKMSSFSYDWWNFFKSVLRSSPPAYI